jgi:hypothetical protein
MLPVVTRTGRLTLGEVDHAAKAEGARAVSADRIKARVAKDRGARLIGDSSAMWMN